eukprot:TRINITY_DN21469_c0_g1_i2.p1 TRINITY_DN21469_c0_g1~~TRINITY_DN21469_c0_g1_i2.p1  ORF type:complete len:121 (-),score=24.42 TRINITY_DN21469_c0_g1_i2:145-507(-)
MVCQQYIILIFFFQAEDGIRDAQESRGLGDVYKRQVAAYTQRQHAYFPTITAAYTTVNWLDDLRGQCLFAGIQGPCTFVITDAHIKDESYLEYINAALSSGDVPGPVSYTHLTLPTKRIV